MNSLLVVIRDAGTGKWLRFRDPRRCLIAQRPGEVMPALEIAESAVRAGDLSAAGFVSYEAAPAFDAALPGRSDPDFPLLVLGVFGPPEVLESLPAPAEPLTPGTVWAPSVPREGYERAVGAIREEIRRGKTYQVNLTFRLRSRMDGDPWQWFLQMAGVPPPPYAAYIETGDWAILSLSPELFFRKEGESIESRPMKGTARRGFWPGEDRDLREALRGSEKDRAENLMIVDMVRNDLGRVAWTGTVHVPRLFSLEKYPTVWQMTSTVAAETGRSVKEILQAAFPPASITGAPKRSAMEIIQRLEDGPRRVYTGTIGFFGPGVAQFNVAIRTLVVNRMSREAEYGVGSGIVWQSDPAAEWEECLAKSRALREAPREFELLETMLYTRGEGVSLLDRHLRRLEESADYFDFRIDPAAIREQLDRACRQTPLPRAKLRLLLSREGSCRIEFGGLGPAGRGPVVIGMAKTPVDSSDRALYHKTTDRRLYERALSEAPGCDDALLFNERGEVTESTVANVAVRIGAELFTPPLRCGLLGGTHREWMLERRMLRERVIRVEEVLAGAELYLMNSVRGISPAVLWTPGRPAPLSFR